MNQIHRPIALAPTPNAKAEPSLFAFDFDAAHAEGWTLSDLGRYKDGAPHVELQKLDRLSAAEGGFASDRDAWAHVVKRAREGSPLHIGALALIDRREKLGVAAHCGGW